MYKNNRRSILFPILLALAVVLGIFIGTLFQKNQGDGLPIVRNAAAAGSDNKISMLLREIDSKYLDPVSLDSITEAIMPMIMGELDPHSVYLPASEFTQANESLDGEFDGVGVVFNASTDTIVVLNVIPGGPSDKAGVINGDRIIKIDGALVAGNETPQENILKMLRGKRGTTVDLSIERVGFPALVPITVTRDKIPIRSLTTAFEISPGIAYLKLGQFSKNSDVEIDTALVNLRDKGVNKLILDLRDNPGGFLDQAITIAKAFLPSGKLIVYTEDRYKRKRESYTSAKGKFADMELVILINEGSASSSEILTGAIQDNDRGTIIGRRSFGKGLVQEQIMFPDGSGARLTVERYFTPVGRSIQKPYANVKEYYADMANRYNNNEFFSADSIHFADSLRFTTPGGRTVYGGGGIMPDIFVPLDTLGVTPFVQNVMLKNVLYKYTLEYTDRHRAKLNAITSVQQLNAFFDADKELYNNFVNYAARHGVSASKKEMELSRKVLEAQIRAYIGRNTPLDEVGFYSQLYVIDDTLLRAISVLSTKK